MRSPLDQLTRVFNISIGVLLGVSVLPLFLVHWIDSGTLMTGLKWNTPLIFLIQVILAIFYFRSERDIVVPMVAILLFPTALLDLMRLLVDREAVHIFSITSDHSSLLWAGSRIYHSFMLALGLLALNYKNYWLNKIKLGLVLPATLGLAAFVFLLVLFGIQRFSLNTPTSHGLFTVDFFNLAALSILTVLAAPHFLRFTRSNLSLFDTAVVISVIPLIITQCLTAFFSDTYGDAYHTAAFYTRFLGYLFPLVGLLASNISIGISKHYTFEQLIDLQMLLENKSKELERENKERSLIQKRLQQSRDFSQAVLETAAEAVIIIDRFGRIEFFNSAAENIFLYSKKEIVGRKVNNLMPLPHDEKHDQYIENFLQNSNNKNMGLGREVFGIKKDGTEFPLQLSISSIIEEDQPKFIGILTDITETVKYREKLKQQASQLELSNKIKDEFVSTVSHELRTPLSSIIGYVDLLLDEDFGELSEEQKEFLGIVSQNSHRLNSLVNDLLDIEKIEEGTIALNFETVSLVDIIKTTCDELRSTAEKKELDLQIELPEKAEFVGDRDRLRQIAVNLVNNAIKYTQKGHVSVNLQVKDATITLTIRDTGIGMSEWTLERLFGRFFRADDDYVREVGGTGLGLSLTKSLIQMHGGDIKVHSRLGEGSDFTVTFPLAANKTNSLESDLLHLSKEDVFNTDIIIVDDDDDFAKILSLLLGKEGFNTIQCRTKKELLKQLETGRFRLIILDVFLPDANGFELYKMLSQEKDYKDPVILLSAKAVDQQQSNQAKALGAKGYISKSSGIDKILQQLRQELPQGVTQ